MSAELARVGGAANFVSARVSAWHKDGIVLPHNPTRAEAMRLAVMDYTVEKRATYRLVEMPTGIDGLVERKYVENKDSFITVRTDTGAELGAVGAIYRPLQNDDAFRALDPLIDSGFLRIETAGVLRDGADAWMLCSMDVETFGPAVRQIFGDEVIPYALITNNHTGRRNATVALTPIRVVCANTLGMAERNMDGKVNSHIKVRHTGDAAVKIVEAAQVLFGSIVSQYEIVAEQYAALKSRIVGEDVVRDLVIGTIAPDPRTEANWNPEAKSADMVMERWERKAALLLNLWENGTGHTGDHSLWEAYNAGVEAIDHHRDLFPIRGGVHATASLLDGTYAQRKQTLLNRVVEYARAS